jgi:nucleoside-diphosphate-sugar epimerase
LTDERTINETFNLGRGEAYSLYDIGFMVAQILNDSPNYDIDLVKIDYQQMPEINGEAFEIRANISKALALGWYPKKSIVQALESTITYLEEQVLARHIDPKTFMADVKIEDVKIG